MSNILANTNTKKETLKIAYICLCHMDPDFIAKTAKTLQYKNDGFFIHVDEKVDKSPFVKACSGLDNVHFVENRIKNYWGGFNSIIATVRTLQLALSTDCYDRFVLLQGQDYPLVSPQKIHDFFELHSEEEFCKAKDISTSKNKRDYMKCCGFWCMDIALSHNSFAKFFRSALIKINSLGIKYRSGKFRNQKHHNWHIYRGWAQFALTRNCVEHLLEVYNTNHRYNRYMKHSFPPDEIYFHTIIYNSPFKDKISKDIIVSRSGEKGLLNVTYFEYPSQVVVFTQKEDYMWLKDMGCLFVRKVNSSSKDLLDEIDKHM